MLMVNMMDDDYVKNHHIIIFFTSLKFIIYE